MIVAFTKETGKRLLPETDCSTAPDRAPRIKLEISLHRPAWGTQLIVQLGEAGKAAC